MKEQKRKALENLNKAIEGLFGVDDCETQRDDLCDIRHQIEQTLGELSTGENHRVKE